MGQDKFSSRLLDWFDQHGRHDLPWQLQPSPYRVWVSEIMLQQTQVATVIPYYIKFMQRFPKVNSLAEASQDEVLHLWAGLGYYARGRNLHRSAGIIADQHRGQFPENIESVNALPGIGRSTAGAILSLSLNQRHPILDGNVKRSLSRYHGVEGFPGAKKVEARLWEIAEQHTPYQRSADYTQAIMDMGATLCTRSKPNCTACPHQVDCVAYRENRVASLPHPRPKRIKPEKHKYMLIFIDTDSNILLFKRPTRGIWGGLYSLPEFDSEQQYKDLLARTINNKATTIHISQNIKHSFTHFDLSITPIYLRLSPAELGRTLRSLQQLDKEIESGVRLNAPAQHALHQEATRSKLGIPAAVQKILDQTPLRDSACWAPTTANEST